MPPVEKPLVYLILGAAGSGRREVLADLIEGGLGGDEPAAVLLAAGETASDCDAKLPAISRWNWLADVNAIDAELPEGAARVFFISDGRGDLADQVEAFKPWLASQGGELARVLSVVDCQLAEKNPPLLAWFEACIHFSDVVLLTRREGVANKWLSGFLRHFTDQFYPCVFELVKGGRVKNPALVIEPQARRMSHYFEDEQEWIVTGEDGELVDDTDEPEGDEEVTAAPEVDPYFARDAAGRRAKRLPDIAKFLK